MKIVIKISEDLAEDHLKELKLYGFNVKKITNRKTQGITIIASQETDLERISIPEILAGRNYQVRFYAVEEGGKSLNNKSATIVCGKNGEKINALFPIKNPTYCGVHAVFCYSDMHIIKISNDEKINIERIQVRVVDNSEIEVIKTPIFNGKAEDVPYKLAKFGPAIEAAIQKSNVNHCKTIFYAANIK